MIDVKIGQVDEYYRHNIEDAVLRTLQIIYTNKEKFNEKLETLNIVFEGLDDVTDLYKLEEPRKYVMSYVFVINSLDISLSIFSEESQKLIEKCINYQYGLDVLINEQFNYCEFVEQLQEVARSTIN